MHLYVLVAAPFVAELLGVTDTRNEIVGWYSSWIQAAFLVGWALGGGFFGRIGDRIGRSRALCLTILTYALFTGPGLLRTDVVATADLAIPGGAGHRRRVGGGGLAALGDVAAALAAVDRRRAAERRQRRHPAGLVRDVRAGGQQSARGFPGRRAAGLARVLDPPRGARDGRMDARPSSAAKDAAPGIADLFRGEVRRTAVLVILVCSVSLTAHWAFIFWYQQHLRNLPDVVGLTAAPQERDRQHCQLCW